VEAPSQQLRIHLFGKAVDVTAWMHRHPGGAKVLRMYSQRDATDVFQAFHSPMAHKKLAVLLKTSPNVPCALKDDPVSADFRALTKELVERGHFKPQLLAEMLKVLSNLFLYSCAIYLVRERYHHCGALLLALAMQQSGWVGHDYSHHSVFRSPALNDVVARFFAWLQGYELLWWKARHNTHHISTNEEGNDPDIKTSPLFTYVNTHHPALLDRLNALQKQQHLYFVPALGLLHLYWRFESALYIAMRPTRLYLHGLLLVGHYALLFSLFRASPWSALLVGAIAKGLMTGLLPVYFWLPFVPGSHHCCTVPLSHSQE
jgi:fatty acid desaturase